MSELEACRRDAELPLVLIVEDSRTQAMFLRFVLEDAGYAVAVVETGEAAIAFLAARRPAVMITDFHLPDLKGDELCRCIRGSDHSAGLPILILSGEADPEVELIALGAGADGYASKGEASPELVARVAALVQRG